MNRNKSSTQSIVEAGLLAAIILVTYLITTYVPVLGVVFSFALPIPLTILYLRRGFKISIMIVIINTILMSMVSNPISAVSTTFLYSITGLTVGYGVKKQWNATKVIVLSTISSIIGLIINLVIGVYVISGTSLYKMLQMQIDMIKKSMETAQKVYATIGVNIDSNQINDLLNILTVENLLIIMPIGIITMGFIYSLINYNLTKGVGRRLNIKLNDVKNFSYWYIDNRIGAIVIIAMLVSLILSNIGIYVGTVMLAGIGGILKLGLSILGAANVSYFLKNKLKLRKGFIIFICIVLFVDPRFNSIVVSIGLTDLVFDFRGLDSNSLSAALKDILIKKMKK